VPPGGVTAAGAMPLLSVSHVTQHFGGPILLDDVTLAVDRGEKIGVVGRNGAGKSTLLKLLAGETDSVAGQVLRQRGVRVAYQAQELVLAPGATIWEEMRRVHRHDFERAEKLAALEHRLAEDLLDEEKRRVLDEYERLQREHHASGGYDAERRIATVLSSLGLPESAWHQPVDGFSGGERNIIGLARVLLSEPDVMLLDEPSNHLDMEGVEWFLEFVRHSDAAVVMVSHNRHLLDATTERIWEVRNGKVVSWTGNFSDFQRQKAEALALQERHYETQQRLIERIEFQARRLLDMARAYDEPGQARRAKSMLKRLEMMEKIERPDTGEHRFHASLSGGRRHGRIALKVTDFTCSFGDRVLFDRANLEIEYGERVCLVGPNGSGKSTLLRNVLEHATWENPTLRLGASVKVGEYRQLHDVLDHGQTLLRWLANATGLDDRETAKLLHRFLFSRDDLERTIGTLSGGEKSRLQLARLSHDKVNLLLLDEPTNHLDFESCEQLEEMLREFDGTLLVVSHDRYFLDRLVTRVVEVEDRKLVSRVGTFADWWQGKRDSGTMRKSALELRSRKAAALDAAAPSREERERRKEHDRDQRKLVKTLAALEKRIEGLEVRQAELSSQVEAAFGDAKDRALGERLSKELGDVQAEIGRLYGEWETLAADVDGA
jgi:ATP-binding cassette subfamily F protein 3